MTPSEPMSAEQERCIRSALRQAGYLSNTEGKALLAEIDRLREERAIMLIDFEAVVEERNELEAALARVPDDSMGERLIEAFVRWSDRDLDPDNIGKSDDETLAAEVLAAIRAVAAGEQTERRKHNQAPCTCFGPPIPSHWDRCPAAGEEVDDA